LFVSALNEAISSALKLRHKALLAGVKQMLNDPAGVGLVADLYNHALISPLAKGTSDGKISSVIPAYIPSQAFSAALLDVLQGVPGDIASVTKAINGISDPQLKLLLQGFVARAGGRVDVVQTQIADWFDNAMDRLSGSYKRRTQLMTFILGLIVATGFNINSFHVLSELWARPSMAAAISNPGAAAMLAATAPAGGASGAVARPPFPVNEWATALQKLPVGWDDESRLIYQKKQSPEVYVFFVIGLLVTASSAVFGAPFWFDLLQRLVQVRGTGIKPPPDRDKNKATVVSAGTR